MTDCRHFPITGFFTYLLVCLFVYLPIGSRVYNMPYHTTIEFGECMCVTGIVVLIEQIS